MHPKDIAKLVVGAIIAVFLVIGLLGMAYTTIDGTRDVVVSFGKAQKVNRPGLHFKIPLLESVETVDIRTRLYTGLDYNSATSKGLALPVDVSVNWTVIEEAVLTMFVKHGTLAQFERTIFSQKIEAATKAAISQFTAEELLTKRVEVETQIRDTLLSKLDEYSSLISIGGVQVADYGFPSQYLASITAERQAVIDARRAISETAKQKTLDEKVANAAEAEAKAERSRVDAQAYKVTTEAAARAEAIKAIGDAEIAVLREKAEVLTDELVEFTKVQTWNGVTPTHVLGGDSQLILDIESRD